MSRGPLNDLIRLLSRLPGVGRKSGTRMAYYILAAPGRYAEDLAQALTAVKRDIKPCPVCMNPSVESPCEICSDPVRDRSLVMVVESPEDLDAVERTGEYKGLYHVLGGVLSPLAGVGPEALNLEGLLTRAASEDAAEIIVALNPSAEGDATTAWLMEKLGAAKPGLSVTRLARGVPIGSEIKHLDPISLNLAVKGRKGTECD